MGESPEAPGNDFELSALNHSALNLKDYKKD